MAGSTTNLALPVLTEHPATVTANENVSGWFDVSSDNAPKRYRSVGLADADAAGRAVRTTSDIQTTGPPPPSGCADWTALMDAESLAQIRDPMCDDS